MSRKPAKAGAIGSFGGAKARREAGFAPGGGIAPVGRSGVPFPVFCLAVRRPLQDARMLRSSESVVLLGAGASKEAGIPTTFEVTQQLVERVASKPRNAPLASALHFVCGALLAYDAADGTSPFNSLDVERVFAAVQLLGERRTLEVTPFVASWHPAVDALDQPPSTSEMSFDRDLADGLARLRGLNSPHRLIKRLIESVTNTNRTGATYRGLANCMLTELRQLIVTSLQDLRYLAPLVKGGTKPGGLTIGTLNYDLAIESAGKDWGIPVTTGIPEWSSSGHWVWPSEGIRLLKLHGSIDWVWEPERQGKGYLPDQRVVTTDTPLDDQRDPALVFGQRGKLRAQGPFLGLLAEFEKQLADATQLIVIGYSFRDEHVNELIKRWLNEDSTRAILVIDPKWPMAFRGLDMSFRALLERFLKTDEHEMKPQSRLEVWREPCSSALQKLVMRQSS